MNTRILRASRRVRLPLGLLFGALVASPMMAQQTGSAGETVKLEEFVVTGSHIPTTETAYDARTTPVDIMTRKDFDELGYGTVEQVIQSMPYVQASVPTQNNQTGFGNSDLGLIDAANGSELDVLHATVTGLPAASTT